MSVTPEKVKSLLSTFLASSKQRSPNRSVAGAGTRNLTTDGKSANEGVQQSTPIKGGTSSLRSYESFIERLDTFSSSTWFGKPAELSPLICARFGWANVETDNLQCVSCKAYLCGKLPDQSDSDAYKKFREKLKKDILAAHDKFCVLAANPCPESFCLIPCDDPTSLISGFTHRVSSLESVSGGLPNIDYCTLHSHNYDEGQGAAYCKRLLLPDSDTAPEVVALAFTGWACMPSKKDILMCLRCRRQIGLWNFDKQSGHSVHRNGSSEAASEQDQSEEEPPSKMPKMQVKSSFDPVEEHKYWCPWLLPTALSSSSATAAATSPAGGKRTRDAAASSSSSPAFIQALKTMAPGLMDNNTGLAQAMKISPMTDGLRCFRRVIKDWSSPKATTTDGSPESTATKSTTTTTTWLSSSLSSTPPSASSRNSTLISTPLSTRAST